MNIFASPLRVLLAMTVLSGTPAKAAEWQGTIVTANERDNTLSFITWPQKVQTRIAVPIAPHNVQFTRDGKLLLAVGVASGGKGHERHGAGGLLVIIDALSPKSGPMATVALPGHPAHVVADRDGRFAYATDADSNAVIIVDLTAKAIVASIPVGSYPHGLRMSPDEREIYVANMRADSVSVIDVPGRKEVARIRVGKRPVQVGFTRDGKLAFASLNAENAVAVIDTEKRTLVAKKAVDRGPVQVFASADSTTILVANQGREQRPDNRISIVPIRGATNTRHVVTGSGAHGVAVSENGSLVAVTNTYANSLTVIDGVSIKVLDTLEVGAAPNGVTMSTAPAR